MSSRAIWSLLVTMLVPSVSTGVWAQQPAAAIAAPAVELPELSGLETAVADQIRTAARRAAAASDAGGARARAEAFGTLAEILHAYEFFDAAEAAYANAMKLVPGEARWSYLLAYLYQQTGRLEQAAEQFNAARRLQPANRAATIRLAESLVQLNRLREARAEFERVLEVFPALAQRGLGEVALREGRHREAVQHFEAAMARAPFATSLHYQLAMAYRGLGRTDRAQQHIARLGQGTIRVGDPIVDALEARIEGERGLVALGRRAFDDGRLDAAAAAFTRAAAAAPGSAVPHVNLGLTRLKGGDGAAAAAHFEAALRIEPSNAEAHAGLGAVRVREQKDDLALVHLRSAFEQRPDDAAIARPLVGVLARLGLADEAIAVLERLRAANQDDEDSLLGLVLLLSGRERYREALALLDDANARFPDRSSTATTLARMLASAPDRSLRDGPRALALAEAVHAGDALAVHAETVAMALAELGRCGEAREWMSKAVDAAQAAADRAETARLKEAAPLYAGTPCRPGGP
jgi:tetratricopeptide (TPR) repeat protein